MTLKKCFNVALLALPLVVLSGCRPYNQGGSFTLTVWDSQENKDMIEELCASFIRQYEERYPSMEGTLTIEFHAQEEGSAVNNLSEIASSGVGGDVVAFVNDTLLTAVDNNLFDPLNQFEPAMEEIITPEAFDALSVEDENGISQLYAYPYAQETNVLIYLDNELSASDVTSWASLKASGKARILMDIDGTVSNTNSGYYVKQFLTDSRIFIDSEGNYSNSMTDFVISTEENVNNLLNFYTNYKDLIVPAIVGNAVNRLTSTNPEFHVNAVITTPYNYNVLLRNESLADHLKIAPLPTLDGNIIPEPFNGYKAYGVNRYSRNPSLAHELAYYLSTNLQCLMARANIGVNPVLSDEYMAANPTSTAELALMVARNECTAIVDQHIDDGIIMPSVPNFARYWSVVNGMCQNLWNLSSYTTETINAVLEEAEASMLAYQ